MPTERVDTRDHPVPLRVLFLCTGNSARSQIAEALLQRKGGHRFHVASAGTNPASRVSDDAIAALAAIGIDWSDRKPKGFEAINNEEWDMIITLCDRSLEACASIPGRPVYAHWGTPDPAGSQNRSRAFTDTVQLLAWRIDLMLMVSFDALQRAALETRLNSIGQSQSNAKIEGAGTSSRTDSTHSPADLR
jgi:protein-tyrosine-phosphatase